MYKSVRRIQYLSLSFTVLFVLFGHLYVYLTITKTKSGPDATWNNVSCPQVMFGKPLIMSTNSLEFNPPPDSIFFHETSCCGGLDSRQACSIESAARLHPKKHVYVLFNSPLTIQASNQPCLSILKQYPNIIFARVPVETYAFGTELEAVIKHKYSYMRKWHLEHTSDLFRFVTLYRYGGIYIDTDVIVVKPLDRWGMNWIGREDAERVNTGIIALSKNEVGNNLTVKIMMEIVKDFKEGLWTYNLADDLTRVMKVICKTFDAIGFSAEKCRGFAVHPPDKFCPIHRLHYKRYFRTYHLENYDDAYAHRTWRWLSSHYNIYKNSYFDQLAKEYCPVIYRFYGKEFGF